MDYHVFLLSRIKEHFDMTGDNEESVAAGLRTTGRLITGAALIMVGVFSGFSAADLTGMQQFGFGLAAAILLDATIVRTILVPASMALLGNRNWYLPAWLAWLPEIHIDGTPSQVVPEPRPATTLGSSRSRRSRTKHPQPPLMPTGDHFGHRFFCSRFRVERCGRKRAIWIVDNEPLDRRAGRRPPPFWAGIELPRRAARNHPAGRVGIRAAGTIEPAIR